MRVEPMWRLDDKSEGKTFIRNAKIWPLHLEKFLKFLYNNCIIVVLPFFLIFFLSFEKIIYKTMQKI